MIFFVIPLVLAISIHMWAGVAVILLSVFTSIAYHVTGSMRIFRIDRLSAIALIIFCWVMAILGRFPYPHFEITLLLGGIALGIYFNQEHPPSGYRVKHTIWHILSAFVVTSSIVMYLAGTMR